MIIGVDSSKFTVFLSLSGVAEYTSNAFTGWNLTYLELMGIVVLIYLFLGLVMEPFGAMLITLLIFALHELSLA